MSNAATSSKQAATLCATNVRPVSIHRERESYVPMQHYFNKIWSDILHAPNLLNMWHSNGWTNTSLVNVMEPALDIIESDKAFKICVELPGMEEKDVEVSVNANYLTVKGHKKEIKEEENEYCVSRECRFGSFQRSLKLPETANPDKARASYKQGILTITLPKKTEALKDTRKLEIQNAA